MESLNNSYDEHEEYNFEASFEVTIDPERAWFENSIIALRIIILDLKTYDSRFMITDSRLMFKDCSPRLLFTFTVQDHYFFVCRRHSDALLSTDNTLLSCLPTIQCGESAFIIYFHNCNSILSN
jgi:hypothetical protein